MGAPHLSACGGKLYWELRVVAATGWAGVCVAGTRFRCGLQAPQGIWAIKDRSGGDDKASWALYVDDGKRNHRWPSHHISSKRFV